MREGPRRRRREGYGATCPVASSMASGGMSALAPELPRHPAAALGRDSPRVATTTSAQSRVCFEVNAAVVVVVVLVLRHTSSSSPGAVWALSLCRCQGRWFAIESNHASLLHCCNHLALISGQDITAASSSSGNQAAGSTLKTAANRGRARAVSCCILIRLQAAQ